MKKDNSKYFRKLTNAHYSRTERYVALMRILIANAGAEFSDLSLQTTYDGNGQFFFDDYGFLKARADEITSKLFLNMYNYIGRCTSNEWNRAIDSMNGLLTGFISGSSRFSNDIIDGDLISRYLGYHNDALAAFQSRATNGMNLSHRVWNIANNVKKESQLAISVASGVLEGISANSLAERVKKYLLHTDELYSDARDLFGAFKMDSTQQGYGPGVYTNSLKNAERLARNEINNAYREAENTKYQEFDFVVGKEIFRSTHVDEKGEPYNCDDICERLKGKYPKDFPFVGWHVNCRCYEVPILCTDEEMNAYTDAILNGDDSYQLHSVNEVTDVPDNFNQWVRENADRIARSDERGTTPWFINKNRGAVNEALQS